MQITATLRAAPRRSSPARSGSPEFSRRFRSVWHDRWVFLPHWVQTGEYRHFTSYQVYLTVQAFAFRAATLGREPYSIIVGSLLSRAILIGSFAGLLAALRPRVSAARFWGFAIGTGMVLLGTGWIAFLNSFYEEQLAIVFLPLLAALLVRHRTGPGTGFLALMVCAAWIGAAKAQYFYLPILVACFAFPVLPSGFWRSRAALALLCAQVFALAPLLVSNSVRRINAYNSVYHGTLEVLRADELLALGSIGGRPIVERCVGSPLRWTSPVSRRRGRARRCG